ncbi:MAG: hypothetical protein R6U27_06140 [Desulfobacterales bacterium]
MVDKRELLASLEKQLHSLESEIAQLKELAAKVKKDSTKIIAEVQNLEDDENILKMEVNELKKSGEAWEDLEIGVQKQIEDLTLNISAALNKFKERVK